MYPELTNKVVVVTGAGAGIGRGIAHRFGQEGAIVIVNDLHPEAAQKTVNEIKTVGGQAIAIAGDMTQAADVKRLFDQLIETYKRVDVLVSNVGLFEFGELVGSDEEAWDRCFDINVKSAFLCSNRAALEMKKAGTGRMIFISSGAGKIGGTWSGGYAAAKWAVLGLAKSLAAELAPNILVNEVCPGIIGTDMDEAFVQKIAPVMGTTPEEFKKNRAASIPLKRVGTPEDVANVVVFLASDQVKYTIGEAFNISGGLVMH